MLAGGGGDKFKIIERNSLQTSELAIVLARFLQRGREQERGTYEELAHRIKEGWEVQSHSQLSHL